MARQLRMLPADAGSPVKIRDGRIEGPLDDAPVVVSLGVGVDSVAMLIELKRCGVRPDAVVTALVGQGAYGNEHRRFYANLFVVNDWLRSVGFPPITFVWYALKRKAKHFHYESLAGNCIANRCLPSIAYRRSHSCSLKWKGEEIDKWVTSEFGSQACYRLIGYDCTETKRVNRFAKPKRKKRGARSGDHWFFPLQLWGMDRGDCRRTIAAEGLPDPGKSSCIFCSSMHPEELDDLFIDELWRIVIIEAHAHPKLKTIQGLWGHDGSMTDYIVERGLLPADLVQATWDKWAAEERPPELQDNPDAVADEVLFQESYRLAELCGYVRLPVLNGDSIRL